MLSENHRTMRYEDHFTLINKKIKIIPIPNQILNA